jgi:hypothetical protein
MFVLYVEGPRDRDVLLAWAHRVHVPLGRALVNAAVILGGRQPERAVAHFRELRERRSEARGLCVLDRDGNGDAAPAGQPGLDFHVWRRRHIESYLLVPEAIRRSLRLPPHDRRVARALDRLLPEARDDRALRALDAKRLLAPDGELARSLGLPVSPGRIARAMRADELDPEVHGLLDRAVASWRAA